MQTLSISVDEEILEQATSVIEDMGLTLSNAVQVFLKRVARDRSLDCILARQVSTPSTTSSTQIQRSGIEADSNLSYPISRRMAGYTSEKVDRGEMRKRSAIYLFRKKGYSVYGTITFASKNRASYNYWANPNFDYLNEDWWLILNDWVNRKLYLFQIPRNAIQQEELVGRNDQPNLIDLQIYENDPNFTDMRSGCSFKRFLVDEINY